MNTSISDAKYRGRQLSFNSMYNGKESATNTMVAQPSIQLPRNNAGSTSNYGGGYPAGGVGAYSINASSTYGAGASSSNYGNVGGLGGGASGYGSSTYGGSSGINANSIGGGGSRFGRLAQMGVMGSASTTGSGVVSTSSTIASQGYGSSAAASYGRGAGTGGGPVSGYGRHKF
jgi:hypothetical protein